MRQMWQEDFRTPLVCPWCFISGPKIGRLSCLDRHLWAQQRHPLRMPLSCAPAWERLSGLGGRPYSLERVTSGCWPRWRVRGAHSLIRSFTHSLGAIFCVLCQDLQVLCACKSQAVPASAIDGQAKWLITSLRNPSHASGYSDAFDNNN